MRLQLLFFTLILTISSACGSEEGALIPAGGGSPSGEQIPPLLTISSPSNSAMYFISAVTISGTATDNTVVSNIFLRVDGGSWSPVTHTGSNWSTNLSLPNGEHTVSLFCMDTNSNCSLTNSRTFTINVDATAPIVTITNPSAGTLNTTNISISGTATDNRAIEAVFLSIDSGPFAEVDVMSGSWRTNIALPEGAHTVSVYAMDTNGNCSATNNRSFTIALDAPTVSIVTPINDSFTNSASITVAGTASINSGSLTGVEVKIGTGSYISASSTDSWATWNSALSLNEGANTITARVTSDSGKQSEASITVTLDTTPPGITAIAPKNSTNRFKSDENIYFDISSSSDSSGIRRIVLLKDGIYHTEKSVSASSLSSERVSITALNTVGTYQFGFYLVDGAGNRSTTNTVTVSTYCEPELWYITPSAYSYTAALSTTVSGTANIDIGTISQIRVKAGTNGNWVTTTSSDGFATWSANLPLAAGNNNIIIEAASDAGITVSKTIYSVYSDRTPPIAAITGPADGFSIEHNTEFMIQAASSEDISSIGVATLVVLTNGGVLATINNPSATESITCPGFPAAGNHTVSVYSINGVGLYSSTNSITVNATEPFLQADSLTWYPATSDPGNTSGSFVGYLTLALDATVYYMVVNKGYPPTAAELKAGNNYTSGGENVTVRQAGSTAGSVGSVSIGGYLSGLITGAPNHVYCVAETSGGQMSRVRFAGTFYCNSSNVLPIMETLIFTEYIEGTGDNKALEIYNGTGKPVNLDQYWINWYANSMSSPYGSGWAAGRSGTVLGQGEFYIFCNSGADSTILSAAQKDVGSLDYNGNDSIVLLNPDGLVIDSIGKIGENPSSTTGWSGSGVQTVDRTLRRKRTLRRGDSDPNDAFDPSVEWTSHPNGTFDGLGSWQE